MRLFGSRLLEMAQFSIGGQISVVADGVGSDTYLSCALISVCSETSESSAEKDYQGTFYKLS